MKLSRKLVMVSVAALLGVSPVVAGASMANPVEAATVYKTYGKGRVTVKSTTHFVNKNGKKVSKKAIKGSKYTIWLVTRINGKLYYGIQSNGAYWIPASLTKGSVKYSTKKTTNKKQSSKKTSKKVSTKKTEKKTTVKKTSKKTSSKKSTKSVSVKIKAIRKTPVVGKDGKKVKTYMGSKKWTQIGKNVVVNGHGTKTIKGVKYYALDPSHFVKASDFKLVK